MSEQWRDVVGYKGLYRVSDLGRVRKIRGTGAILQTSPCTASIGRLTLSLSKNSNAQAVYADLLVLAAFVGPCPDGQTALHGESGIADNSLGNLSYGRRVWKGRRVRRSDGTEFVNLSEAARCSGCHGSGIWRVCNGKAKRAGGWGWEYCN